MVLYKISFRFDRDSHNLDYDIQHNEEIKGKIQSLFEDHDIEVTRIFAPSHNSIKVLFPNEFEHNKTMARKSAFVSGGFYPKISMAVKSTRTIICTGFDESLIIIYGKEGIISELRRKGWEVVDIHIMQNRKALKIEFVSSMIADNFLGNQNTSIGAIKIRQDNKEKAVNSTINQCWGCGIINANHGFKDCCGDKRCLKCGNRDHTFHNCSIPRTFSEMTPEDKLRQYCIPCGLSSDHTSLDFTRCPTKRKIIQDRIMEAREIRKNNLLKHKGLSI